MVKHFSSLSSTDLTNPGPDSIEKVRKQHSRHPEDLSIIPWHVRSTSSPSVFHGHIVSTQRNGENLSAWSIP